jgi:hypothetical protein
LIGVDRKRPAHGQSGAIDPTSTSPVDAPGKINALLSATMIEM